jgi:hypothetical protein
MFGNSRGCSRRRFWRGLMGVNLKCRSILQCVLSFSRFFFFFLFLVCVCPLVCVYVCVSVGVWVCDGGAGVGCVRGAALCCSMSYRVWCRVVSFRIQGWSACVRGAALCCSMSYRVWLSYGCRFVFRVRTDRLIDCSCRSMETSMTCRVIAASMVREGPMQSCTSRVLAFHVLRIVRRPRTAYT